MLYDRFDTDFREFERMADLEETRPGQFRRIIAGIIGRLANRRPDLRDFSAAQLRDIGLTRNDIERF